MVQSNQLKAEVLAYLKKCANSKHLPEAMRKTVPMIMVIYNTTSAPLKELKKAIEDLQKEEQIYFLLGDDTVVRAWRLFNRVSIEDKITDEDKFICSLVGLRE